MPTRWGILWHSRQVAGGVQRLQGRQPPCRVQLQAAISPAFRAIQRMLQPTGMLSFCATTTWVMVH